MIGDYINHVGGNAYRRMVPPENRGRFSGALGGLGATAAAHAILNPPMPILGAMYGGSLGYIGGNKGAAIGAATGLVSGAAGSISVPLGLGVGIGSRIGNMTGGAWGAVAGGLAGAEIGGITEINPHAGAISAMGFLSGAAMAGGAASASLGTAGAGAGTIAAANWDKVPIGAGLALGGLAVAGGVAQGLIPDLSGKLKRGGDKLFNAAGSTIDAYKSNAYVAGAMGKLGATSGKAAVGAFGNMARGTAGLLGITGVGALSYGLFRRERTAGSEANPRIGTILGSVGALAGAAFGGWAGGTKMAIGGALAGGSLGYNVSSEANLMPVAAGTAVAGAGIGVASVLNRTMRTSPYFKAPGLSTLINNPIKSSIALGVGMFALQAASAAKPNMSSVYSKMPSNAGGMALGSHYAYNRIK